jgi:hypothetical protein
VGSSTGNSRIKTCIPYVKAITVRKRVGMWCVRKVDRRSYVRIAIGFGVPPNEGECLRGRGQRSANVFLVLRSLRITDTSYPSPTSKDPAHNRPLMAKFRQSRLLSRALNFFPRQLPVEPRLPKRLCSLGPMPLHTRPRSSEATGEWVSRQYST